MYRNLGTRAAAGVLLGLALSAAPLAAFAVTTEEEPTPTSTPTPPAPAPTVTVTVVPEPVVVETPQARNLELDGAIGVGVLVAAFGVGYLLAVKV